MKKQSYLLISKQIFKVKESHSFYRYLGDIALPNFKKKKVQAYYNIMKDLSGSEQNNFTNLLEGWKVKNNAKL